MIRWRAALVIAAFAAAPATAQRADVQLSLALPSIAAAEEGPTIATANVLADAKTQELLRNGFPAALHYRLDLWRKGSWFSDLTGSTQWDVFVSYDPSGQRYQVVRRHGRQLEDFGGFPTLSAAEAQVDRAYRVALRPTRRGRYYYNVSLEIETLSVSDLDALQRWLRGEAQPAVRGRGNPATALRSGLGTLFSRLLGGEKRHFEERSGTFRVE